MCLDDFKALSFEKIGDSLLHDDDLTPTGEEHQLAERRADGFHEAQVDKENAENFFRLQQQHQQPLVPELSPTTVTESPPQTPTPPLHSAKAVTPLLSPQQQLDRLSALLPPAPARCNKPSVSPSPSPTNSAYSTVNKVRRPAPPRPPPPSIDHLSKSRMTSTSSSPLNASSGSVDRLGSIGDLSNVSSGTRSSIMSFANVRIELTDEPPPNPVFNNNLSPGLTLPNQADGESICYSGWTGLTINKKSYRRLWCTLRNKSLTFYPSDEEDAVTVAGPVSLQSLEYVGRDTSSSSANALSLVCAESSVPHTSAPLHVQLAVDQTAELRVWLMLLAKTMAPAHDTLVYGMDAVDQAGSINIRQGSICAWCRGWGFMRGRDVFYVCEVDLRKLITLSRDVPRQDWSTTSHRTSLSPGPVLLTQDGSSLYIEAPNDLSTQLWHDVLHWQLTVPSNKLDEQRLTVDNVPVIVDKCIKFIATHGLLTEGIYRKSGSSREANQLMEDFKRDPLAVHITRHTDESVHCAASVLRSFFRQLDHPLIPHSIQSRLFQISAMPEADLQRKVELYQEALDTIPVINYQTLRKVFDHLKDVSENSSKNKATIPNIAKVFGPTLLSVDRDDENNQTVTGFEHTGQQVQVVHDLISNFIAIFNVTDEEIKTKSRIHMAGQSNSVGLDMLITKTHGARGLLAPIHLIERDNQAFNVQADMTAAQVVAFAVRHRKLSPTDGPYGLFEVARSGRLKRKVWPNETVLSMVAGRWLDWKEDGNDCYLLVERDAFSARFEQALSFPSPFVKDIKIAEVGSKSFKKAVMQCRHGHVSVYKDAKCQKPFGEWPVEDMIWFTGHDLKRDPAPFPHTLTFVVEKDQRTYPCPRTKLVGVCVAFKVDLDLYRWLAAVLPLLQAVEHVSTAQLIDL